MTSCAELHEHAAAGDEGAAALLNIAAPARFGAESSGSEFGTDDEHMLSPPPKVARGGGADSCGPRQARRPSSAEKRRAVEKAQLKQWMSTPTGQC